MKIPVSIPTPLFVGILAFLVLLFGGYFVGNTQAVSTQRVALYDPTGSNGASVNAEGHLSVHVADGGLPAFTGPLGTRHISFPVRPGLVHGECYAAFIRGGGSFESASVGDRGGGGGRPQVLVRIDSYPVWVEDGKANSTPVSPATGVSHSQVTYTFGYTYSLSFKAFAGVMLCWHGVGTSDSFDVQMTIANGGGNPYLPEELTFSQRGKTFVWRKLQGLPPIGYQLMGTDSTGVSYYEPLAESVEFVPHQHTYSSTISVTPPKRFYVFELQGGDPTRVGPFGDWSDE